MIKEHNKAEEEIEGERDKGAFFPYEIFEGG